MPVSKAQLPNTSKKIKKSTKAKHEGARFWMDDYSYRRLYAEPESSLAEIISLYSIKKTIGNFVQITSNTPVKVTYAGSNSFVDPQHNITISANLKDFDTVVGLSLHESSHISYSILNIYESLYKIIDECNRGNSCRNIPTQDNELARLLTKYFNIVNKNTKMAFNLFRYWKNFTNWIEDRRIDFLQTQRFPGYTQYYEKLYSNYFYAESVSKGLRSPYFRTQTFDSYDFRITNSLNDDSDKTALPNLNKMLDLISIDNITNCKNNYETADLALKLFAMVLNECKNNIDNSGNTKSDKDVSEENKAKSEASKNSKGESEKSEEKSNESKSKSNEKSDDKSNENKSDDESKDDESEDENDNENDDESKDENENKEKFDEDEVREDIKSIMKKIEALLNQNDQINKESIDDSAAAKIKLLENGELQILKATEIGAHILSINRITESVRNEFGSLFSWGPDHSQIEHINKGINQGVVLGKKLQIMNDEKIIETIRKHNGQLNQRLIPEISFGNERIFSHTSKQEFSKLYVHLTLDCSGSMRGEPWYMALQMAAALVVALSYVEGARIVVSTRSTITIESTDNPYNLVMYDSKIDNVSHIRKWWGKLRVTGNTPEGLVFDALMSKILKDANGSDAFFINLSDGCPSCGAMSWTKSFKSNSNGVDYSGHSALEHTRRMVDLMVKNNITVISYYVSKTLVTSHDQFEKMYGKYAHYILVTDMMQLARTLNKRFIQRNKVTK